MGLREQLMDDLKQAMRERDERRKVAIRSIIAALKQAETELGPDGERVSLKDDGILALIAKQARQREESIIEFHKGRREDLVAAEEAELAILRTYLPQQMTREQIEAEVRRVIAEIGDSGAKDMGAVMKPLMVRLKGRADGRLVNQIVRELLAG
jgi:uncharacterized protein YqeY